MKKQYVTFSNPKLLLHQLLSPLAFVGLLAAVALLLAREKAVSAFGIVAAFIGYSFLCFFWIVLYGKAYQRIRIDESGIHTRCHSILWEQIEAYRLEDITVAYNVFIRADAGSVVGINCGESDKYRSHSVNCIYFPLNQKALNAIQFFSRGRSSVMTDFLEKYSK